ncbi:hypothetical protein ACTNDY_14095, partial [Tissierellaceae bacterium HCP3S3_D8]
STLSTTSPSFVIAGFTASSPALTSGFVKSPPNSTVISFSPVYVKFSSSFSVSSGSSFTSLPVPITFFPVSSALAFIVTVTLFATSAFTAFVVITVAS